MGKKVHEIRPLQYVNSLNIYIWTICIRYTIVYVLYIF